MSRIRLAAAAVLIAVSAAAVRAQVAGPALSFDLSAGAGQGRGAGAYRATGGPALDALVALRRRPAARAGAVFAVSASAQGPFASGSTDDCFFAPPGARGGPCLRDFPVVAAVGALAGWEFGAAAGRTPAARLLAGPGYAYMDGDDAAGQRGGALALLGRLDVAQPLARRVAVVGSLRAGRVPRFRGAALATTAAGLGLRIR